MPSKCHYRDPSTEARCHKEASFGNPNEKVRLRCKDHAEPGMVAVHTRPVCEVENCNKKASCGLPSIPVADGGGGKRKRPSGNQRKLVRCLDHMLEGMVRVKYETHCKFEGCQKKRKFGTPPDGLAEYCGEHREKGMDNVFKRRMRGGGGGASDEGEAAGPGPPGGEPLPSFPSPSVMTTQGGIPPSTITTLPSAIQDPTVPPHFPSGPDYYHHHHDHHHPSPQVTTIPDTHTSPVLHDPEPEVPIHSSIDSNINLHPFPPPPPSLYDTGTPHTTQTISGQDMSSTTLHHAPQLLPLDDSVGSLLPPQPTLEEEAPTTTSALLPLEGTNQSLPVMSSPPIQVTTLPPPPQPSSSFIPAPQSDQPPPSLAQVPPCPTLPPSPTTAPTMTTAFEPLPVQLDEDQQEISDTLPIQPSPPPPSSSSTVAPPLLGTQAGQQSSGELLESSAKKGGVGVDGSEGGEEGPGGEGWLDTLATAAMTANKI